VKISERDLAVARAVRDACISELYTGDDCNDATQSRMEEIDERALITAIPEPDPLPAPTGPGWWWARPQRVRVKWVVSRAPWRVVEVVRDDDGGLACEWYIHSFDAWLPLVPPGGGE
jgi:hypothetical protein